MRLEGWRILACFSAIVRLRDCFATITPRSHADIMQFYCHREERTEKVRPELLAETRKHKAAKLLRQIPCIGPIRYGPYCVKQSPNS